MVKRPRVRVLSFRTTLTLPESNPTFSGFERHYFFKEHVFGIEKSVLISYPHVSNFAACSLGMTYQLCGSHQPEENMFSAD